MNTASDLPQSLLEAVRYFAGQQLCHDYLVRIKYPDGKITCPRCGRDQVGIIRSRRILQCKRKKCRKQFSAKVGTIFEDSPLGLDKWFVAVWCIANAKNGISSHELGRALGVTQKTAWFMLHRVRLAMRTGSFRILRGEIESDETYIGGKARNMHKGKRKAKGSGVVGKAIVQGLLERGGEVRAMRVHNTTAGVLQNNIRRNVEPGSHVYTDIGSGYTKGLDIAYVHKMVDHTKRYVEGRVHTNGLENFWSLFKRCIHGTYVAIAPAHLGRYVDEQVFRFNKRKGTDATRFAEAMLSVPGKRLTYAALTAQKG